ncbi:MAG: protein-glutamate O-methyltransferase CheR [Rhodospirillales bacterium]|nr:protein-glutamate O-methyltransferase CheR [Rhodospirillales bacterium]
MGRAALSEHSLDSKLRALAQGLASLRQAAGDATSASLPLMTVYASPLPPPPRLSPDDPRAASVHRLMLDVERKAGIKVGPQVEAKLARLLAETPPVEVASWVSGLERLEPEHPDWLDLVESLTVHETYFYRDQPQLDYLRRQILPGLIAERRGQPRPALTIWSAACSTGEEAYTFAMIVLLALLEAGEAVETAAGVQVNSRWNLSVLGTDISRQALRHAAAACYTATGLSSFRDLPRDFERFFVVRPPGHERMVRGDARALVRFQRYNLLSARPAQMGCDVVACRNVLVYFDAQGRRVAQESCWDALRPGGMLMLGPADTIEFPDRFRTIWGPATVMYEKKG